MADQPVIIDAPEAFPDPLPDGTALRYALGDSGMDFPQLGLFLSPRSDLVVGEDLDGQLAARFVERGTLSVVSGEGDSTEESKQAAADAPAHEAGTRDPAATPVAPAAAPRVPPALLQAAETIVEAAHEAPPES